MKTIEKEYGERFVLEPTKLSRIVDKIHERFADHPKNTWHDTFEVFLSGNRHEEMSALDDVLALDNSRKRKIERLVVRCSAATLAATKPEHEVEVDFACPKPNPTAPTSTRKVTAITVRSDSPAWASQTLSEVEEQIERTWPHDTGHTTSLIMLMVVLVVALVFLVTYSLFRAPYNGPRNETWWLSSSDAERIQGMLKDHPVLTDEQLREISTMQMRNLLGLARPQNVVDANDVRRLLFLGVPVCVVIGCIVVLLATCYPAAVFLWGDEVHRYTGILQRRKTVWNVVIGVAVVGVLANFLFEGVASWFPRHS